MLSMELNKILELLDVKVCHGDIGRYGSRTIKHICYDSRKVDGDSIFVPIVGEKVDAHRFIPQVLETECCVSFTEREDVLSDCHTDKILILAEDPLAEVQKLAAWYRKSFGVPVVGVTGSVGKTTTREMISLALSAGKKVYATPGNRNSQIGTPDTLFGFDEDAQICVFEMGMSAPGEMSRLAEMVRPDAAVFTNIGVTHIENLGSREAILREKLHITDNMSAGSVVFINNDNDMLRTVSLREGLVRCTYGLSEDCDVYAADIDEHEGYPVFTAVVHGKKVPVKLNTYGRFQIYNALAGLAVAELYGIDLQLAADRLGEYSGYTHRNQIFRNGRITVIDDTYNAAPDSVRAALDMLSTISCRGRRIAVLGDMKELGDISGAAHREAGKYAAGKGNIDLLISYGPLAAGYDEGFRENGTGTAAVHAEDPDSLERILHDSIREGDLILFKGSNSMGLFDYIDRVLAYEFM